MKSKQFKVKKIALSILLVLICFCMCGCAQVNFVTYHNDDGTIQEYVYLAINEQALLNYGYNIDNVKLEIQSNSHLEAISLIEEYQNKLASEYRQNRILNEEYSTLYNGIKLLEQKWEGNEYIIGLQFENSSIYKKYYELLNGTTFSSNTRQIEKLFYTKTYYYGTTNYGDYSIFNRIYNYYINSVFATISPQEATLTYSYSVSSRRFHSDADQVSLDNNGNYIHIWKVEPNEPSQQIYFYTISANRSVWIISCLMISLLICAVLCTIGIFKYIKFKKDKNNNSNIENVENKNNSNNNI